MNLNALKARIEEIIANEPNWGNIEVKFADGLKLEGLRLTDEPSLAAGTSVGIVAVVE
jgi:hypothetical protein